MAQDPRIRASDADREAVAQRLQEAHAEGRLTQDELTERLEQAFTARTLGDLAPIIADLPRPPRPVARQSTPPARTSRTPAKRTDGEVALRVLWTVWAAAVAINVTIWLLVSVSAGDPAYFWPAWVAGPSGAALLVVTLATNRGRGFG